MTGDFSGREAMNSLDDMPKDSNYCAGGCSEWKDTEDGRERYAWLKERWQKRAEN
jgi:hypothetical protein